MSLHIRKLNCRIQIAVPFEDARVPRMKGGEGARAEEFATSSTRDGERLDETTRVQIERMMGHDFGDVRVHTGPEAEKAAASMKAQAFAHGDDVYFGEGEYAPQTPEGMGLLAHELTHVVQQRQGRGAAGMDEEELEEKARGVEKSYRQQAHSGTDIDLPLEGGAEYGSSTSSEGPKTQLSSNGVASASDGPRSETRSAPAAIPPKLLADHLLDRIELEKILEEERRGVRSPDQSD